MIRVRFAPSPTGYIHIGNARIALFNWFFAVQQKGQFILRYDDTDIKRSKVEYIKGIAEDLTWLGIKLNEIYCQSKRFDRYDQAVKKLKKAGLLYPCYETPEELEWQRKRRLSQKLPPVYGRGALRLTMKEKQVLEAQGRKPHWRFLLPNFTENPFEIQCSEVSWDDLVRGRQTIDLSSLSDPVLIRADDTYLYTLPSVVDDMDMRVTHIIRGDDHVANTGVQIAIFKSLVSTLPTFAHINLLTTISGAGLSKRKMDLSIRSLRAAGFEQASIASLAVFIGTSQNVEAHKTVEKLAGHFNLTSASKTAAKFNVDNLVNLNRHIVHELTFDDVADRLMAMDIAGDKAKPFWFAIRNNLETVTEAYSWWKIITDKNMQFPFSSHADRQFLHQAARLLPPEPWNQATWQQWIKCLKEKTDRRKESLFRPLRIALTGCERGPELAVLLPLLGRDLVFARLQEV
ncbi:MAG: glutamyl-tRNA synthetase [Candidatus Tokpelaia sp. JSC085]|nr:MAG: glutamyl-tRNA synthetase [Candidatus Tokpelaia sp. JSC085]